MLGTRTRTTEFDDPTLTAAAAAGKPGIEFLRDVIAGKVPPAPVQATLGFELVEVEDGFAKLHMVPGEHLYGALNAVHGGVAATLLDAAMGSAVMTTLDAVTAGSPVALTVHFTRSISSRTAKVVAEGWVVHRGSRLVTAEARINDGQGRLLAHGSATYALAERHEPG
jgi:uncharacterized protein (TIGR00369 family)